MKTIKRNKTIYQTVLVDEYYCEQCNFSSSDSDEVLQHEQNHKKFKEIDCGLVKLVWFDEEDQPKEYLSEIYNIIDWDYVWDEAGWYAYTRKCQDDDGENATGYLEPIDDWIKSKTSEANAILNKVDVVRQALVDYQNQNK